VSKGQPQYTYEQGFRQDVPDGVGEIEPGMLGETVAVADVLSD